MREIHDIHEMHDIYEAHTCAYARMYAYMCVRSNLFSKPCGVRVCVAAGAPPSLGVAHGDVGADSQPHFLRRGAGLLPPRFKPGVEVLSESLQSPNFGDACPGFSICSLR